MTAKTSRKPKRRGCCLVFIIGALALIGLGVAGFAWLYKHPISNDALHRRVLNRLERISGLPVQYDAATLTLATGKYHISNLRFKDPADSTHAVFTIGDIYATISPWDILRDRESMITDVVLKDPSSFDLVYSINSLKLGERSRFLLDAVRKAQPPGSDNTGRLPFDELKIENATLIFAESAGILPDLAPSTTTMRLAGDFLLKNKGNDALDVQFAGSAGQAKNPNDPPATNAAGVHLNATLDQDNEVTLTGEIEGLALHNMLRDMPATWLRAENLQLDLNTSPNENGRKISGDIKVGNIAIHNPENQFQLQDENLAFNTDLDIRTSPALVNFQSLALTSHGAHFDLEGTSSYESFPPANAEITFKIDRMDEDYRALLERLVPPGWDFAASEEALAINLNTSIHNHSLTRLNGTVAMLGIELKTPVLPARISNLRGEMVFTDKIIEFVDMTGDYAGARIAVDGAFDGDPWITRAGKLNMNWSAIVDLAKVLQYHGDQIGAATTSDKTGESDQESSSFSASGRVAGNGTWQQSVNLSDSSQSDVPHIEGRFDFENVSVQHPHLPAPVSKLNGHAVVDDDSLKVQSLSGTIRGNEMQVDGFMQGDQFFWRDPQVSASLTSQIDLAQVESYLPAQTVQQLEKYNVTGEAETSMQLKGPLADLGTNLTGRVRLRNVGFSPGLEFMSGKIDNLSGAVRWNGSRLNFDGLSGSINGETVDLGGSLSANHIDLQVASNAPLEVIESTFPRLDKYLDMSGGLETDLRFSAGKDSPSPVGSINQVLEQARELLDKSVKDHSFAINGNLKFRDAQLRHIAMPIARTEQGRKIPEGRITKMNGTVRIDSDTLRVSKDNPVSCSFADTPNCKFDGWLKLRPDNFPEMEVNVSTGSTLKLDTWIMGWGKDLPRLDKPPITGKRFDLETSVRAPRVTLRGQEGGRSSGKVSFNMVQDDTPRVTRLNEVIVQGATPGSGRIIGSGRIDSFVWNTQRFPHWQAELDIQAMPLQMMLASVFTQPSNLHGITDGNLRLEGHGKDARSIRGNGSVRMTNLEIGGTAVIQELGNTTGRNFGGMLFETARAATFQIGNGALSSRDIALQANGLQLEMHGDYWFAADSARNIPAKTIDGNLRLKLFKSVFGNIPIIGQVADLADEVTNAFLLAFRVTGTASNPQVTPVPLPMFQGNM